MQMSAAPSVSISDWLVGLPCSPGDCKNKEQMVPKRITSQGHVTVMKDSYLAHAVSPALLHIHERRC